MKSMILFFSYLSLILLVACSAPAQSAITKEEASLLHQYFEEQRAECIKSPESQRELCMQAALDKLRDPVFMEAYAKQNEYTVDVKRLSAMLQSCDNDCLIFTHSTSGNLAGKATDVKIVIITPVPPPKDCASCKPENWGITTPHSGGGVAIKISW